MPLHPPALLVSNLLCESLSLDTIPKWHNMQQKQLNSNTISILTQSIVCVTCRLHCFVFTDITTGLIPCLRSITCVIFHNIRCSPHDHLGYASVIGIHFDGLNKYTVPIHLFLCCLPDKLHNTTHSLCTLLI